MQAESKKTLIIKKNLYKISLLSFMVVIFWIGFEIYFSYTSEIKDEVTDVNLKPIIPNLHVELAEKLSQKETIPLSDLEAFKNSLPTTFPQGDNINQPISTPNPTTLIPTQDQTGTPSATQTPQEIQ